MKHLLIQWAAVWLVLVSAAGCGDRNIGSSEKPTSSPAAPAAAAKVSVAAPAAAAAKVSTAAPAAAAKVTAAAPADIDAAQALFKRNSCNKCHSVDKTKTGPSLQKIAAKYSGKADGQEKIIKNMTMAPKIKFEDGTEEEHKVIDTTDQKELKNLSDWILSQ